MNTIKDIAIKRSIILNTRIRFSSQIQPVKETAIDKIIEQILFAIVSEERITLDQIQDTFFSLSGGTPINSSDIKNSLKRLIENKRILIKQIGSFELYELSEEVKSEIAKVKRQADAQINLVVSRLFKNSKEGHSIYLEPFLKFLSIIFSYLGEESVKLIKGEIKGQDFLSNTSIPSVVKEIKKEYPSIDHSLFENALMTFFQESDPEYNAIKWYMAQNYYITKAIGLDHSGALLSKEIFEKAVFYLDTNIIIGALEPKHKHHKSFLVFSKACKYLGITLKVCQITIDELKSLFAYQRDLIEKVRGQIPDETAPKVRSIFYKVYLEKRLSEEAGNIDDIFASFGSPLNVLRDLFEVQLEDDVWFDEESKKVATLEFAENLKTKYFLMRGRNKSRSAALHDAKLLLWLQKMKEETNNNIWLVTSDTTLPGSVPPNVSFKSLSITLDALLQWISPLVAQEGEEDNFTSIFAEMIKCRFLPQDRFFNLDDFLIFHEMQMSCKDLPAKDVEDCIRFLKLNAPTLDPSNLSDREKLSYEVSKFFADPGRTYKQEIATLEEENIKMKQAYEEKLDDAIKNVKQREKDIEELRENLKKYKDKEQKESLKSSALKRLGITIGVFLVVEGLCLYLSNTYGEGQNLFQKVGNSSMYFTSGPIVFLLMGWFYIRKERLRALGWPFTKVFKS